jgi:hypothetical protein
MKKMKNYVKKGIVFAVILAMKTNCETENLINNHVDESTFISTSSISYVNPEDVPQIINLSRELSSKHVLQSKSLSYNKVHVLIF